MNQSSLNSSFIGKLAALSTAKQAGANEPNGSQQQQNNLPSLLKVFAKRFDTYVRYDSAAPWRNTSKLFSLSDEELALCFEGAAKLQRAFTADDADYFFVISIPSISQFHSPFALETIRILLSQCGLLKSKLYRADHSDTWHLYYFLDRKVNIDVLSAHVNEFLLGNGIDLPNNQCFLMSSEQPIAFPLQNGFAWLSDDGKVSKQRLELNIVSAANQFLDDFADNLNSAEDALESLKTAISLHVARVSANELAEQIEIVSDVVQEQPLDTTVDFFNSVIQIEPVLETAVSATVLQFPNTVAAPVVEVAPEIQAILDAELSEPVVDLELDFSPDTLVACASDEEVEFELDTEIKYEEIIHTPETIDEVSDSLIDQDLGLQIGQEVLDSPDVDLVATISEHSVSFNDVLNFAAPTVALEESIGSVQDAEAFSVTDVEPIVMMSIEEPLMLNDYDDDSIVDDLYIPEVGFGVPESIEDAIETFAPENEVAELEVAISEATAPTSSPPAAMPAPPKGLDGQLYLFTESDTDLPSALFEHPTEGVQTSISPVVSTEPVSDFTNIVKRAKKPKQRGP